NVGRYLERALGRAPTNPEVHLLFGKLHLLEQKLPDALRSYEKAATFAPNYAPARYALAYVYHARGESKQARAEVERAIKLRPNYAEAHNLLVELLATTGAHRDFKQAVEVYRRRLRESAEDAGNHYGLGLALHALSDQDHEAHDLDEAVRAFQTATKLSPDFA